MATATLTLAACTSMPAPLRTIGLDPALTPTRVLADPALATHRLVRWGGVIIHSLNLRRSTRLEILAYPLDRSGDPERGAKPIGRFLAESPGYLETMIYPPGRLITVIGWVAGAVQKPIGAAPYQYPVIDVKTHYIWPRRQPPRPHFGIGVGVGIGG